MRVTVNLADAPYFQDTTADRGLVALELGMFLRAVGPASIPTGTGLPDTGAACVGSGMIWERATLPPS